MSANAVVGVLLSGRVWRRAALLLVALSSFVVLGAPGCGGSSNKAAVVELQEACSLQSDCGDGGLICALGHCRQQCVTDADCTGGNCIIGRDPNGGIHAVCQPANAPCDNAASCVAPLACASDYRCRNLCTIDADCNGAGITGRICATDMLMEHYCAEPGEVSDAGIINEAPPAGAMLDAAVVPPTPAMVVADLEAGLQQPQPDATVSTSLDGSVTNTMTDTGVASDGSTGPVDSGNTSMSDGSTSADGGTDAAVAAACVPPCTLTGTVCMGTACVKCGAAGQPCCTGSTCGTQLVCNASNVCDCGNGNEPCCGGTMCTSPLTCVAGDAGNPPACTCGQVDTACCPAATQGGAQTCLGGAVCAGTNCGCLTEFATDYTTSTALGLALRVDSTVWKASPSPYAQNPAYQEVTYNGSAIRASSIAVSGEYGTALGCAVQGGGVYCFPLGDNVTDSSFLGAGLTSTVTTAGAVAVVTSIGGAALTGVVKIVGGTNGNADFCALDGSGNIWCWGYNGYGQLGTGDTSNATVATKVSGFTGAADVAVGTDSTCAIKAADGTVWCWGYDYQEQLGVPYTALTNVVNTYSQYTPNKVPILGGAGVKAVQLASAPEQTHCAVMQDTSVICWGANTYSQAGVPYASTMQYVGPQSVPADSTLATSFTGVLQVVGTSYTMCAKVSGTLAVKCWGSASGYPNGKPFPTSDSDSNSNAITGIVSPLTGSTYGYLGYVDALGHANSGGSDNNGPQPSCAMLSLADGGAP